MGILWSRRKINLDEDIKHLEEYAKFHERLLSYLKESSVSANEIWIEADGWDALYSYYDYSTQTWPGSELTKNDQNYYVFDISGITNVSSWLLSDNASQQTRDLAASLEAMQQYAGKKIRVTAGSNVVSIVE